MEMANRNKKSVAIDLKTDDGRAALLKLIESADVFLTNFLPSVLDRLGLGVDSLRAINPRLIYARGHGYGVRGADADTPAYDSTSFWARGRNRGDHRAAGPARADPATWRGGRSLCRHAARVRHRRCALPT